MRNNFNWYAIAMMVAAMLWAGCQEDRPGSEVPVFPVSGTVSVGGKPAAGAKITLHQADSSVGRGHYARATVGEDGTFQLSTFVNGDGAPAGEYIVTVRWPDPKVVAQDPFGEREEMPPDMLRGQFSSPRRSNLRLSVPERPIQLKPVDLSSSEVRSQKPFEVAIEPL